MSEKEVIKKVKKSEDGEAIGILEEAVPKINVHTFSSLYGLNLATEARLFYAVAIGKVGTENTIANWEKILIEL